MDKNNVSITNQSNDLQPMRIAVRTLAETVHRQGGLAGPLYAGVCSADGIRLHQRFVRILQERHSNAQVLSEVALSAIFQNRDIELRIGGRCDALLELDDGPRLVEAKSFSGPADRLPPDGEPVHWAQANLYAWIYLSDCPDLSGMQVGLAYLSAETSDMIEMTRKTTRAELESFFLETCKTYVDFAGDILKSKRIRDRSGLICRFPYAGLRAGQKRFMREVVGTAKQKESVFIQAPTGTGKTMAAIYPAAKVIANHLTDHCFYLTNMTSTRLVAASALNDLRQTGLRMKSIILYAKEKLCLEPEIYCDSRQCRFATAYYDHLPAALRELFLLESIGQEEILACARRHSVCPFELSLDMSLYCEFIICDYNYAFDPRVRLSRFFVEDNRPHLLLVDEAHNLPARSREMFSATLEQKAVTAARKAIAVVLPILDKPLEAIDAYMTRLYDVLTGAEPGLDALEGGISKTSVMCADRFRAMRELPATLLSLLARFSALCRFVLDQNPDLPDRRPLIDFYFRSLYFSRVADEFHDKSYVTTTQIIEGQTVVRLLCLDASDKLASTYRDHHPAVFFSATLSPIAYYAGLLNGVHNWERHQTLLLGSPFPAENLLVLVCSTLSTRFRQRQETVQPILGMIQAAIRCRVGNYLVFVPSFAYLSMLRSLIRSNPDQVACDWMFQVQDMNENLRRKYLNRFETYGKKTLVAVAVMGGIFSEGIDLVGEKLAGVVVIGVGLPQISPEREIMRQYYAEALGSGYEYSYLYPGFNKVQQAAGRVIRTETDRGFVLLIDDRYDTPAYRELFPAEWNPVSVQETDELNTVLTEFWNQA